MNFQESLMKAKYNYIDLCNTITNEFNFDKLMSLKTVEEVNEQYERMRFNLIEKLQLVNTKDTEKFITDMLNVQEFVEEQRKQTQNDCRQQREELRTKFNKM